MEIPIAVWDGLTNAQKVSLMTEKNEADFEDDDWLMANKFNVLKLERLTSSFTKLLKNTGDSKLQKLTN